MTTASRMKTAKTSEVQL